MEELDKLIDKIVEPKFYSTEDVSKMTGWSLNTVRNLFNRDDFPSTNLGKEKKVEREALKEYFREPKRR